MAWQTFELPKMPSPLTAAVDGIKTVATAATTALNLLKGLLEALSATAITSLSVTQIAITTAIAAIEAALKSLTEDSGVYVLVVPPRSRVIMPDNVKAALAKAYDVTPTLGGLTTQALFADLTKTPQEAAILQGLFSASNGNAGFVRSVIESFTDEGDANRPVLADTDFVAGRYIVAGAPNIASLIPFTNGLSYLLAAGKAVTLTPPAVPTPQSLKAKSISATGAILLQWLYQTPRVELPTLGTFAQITEVAVIKSTSVTLMSASTPEELFGTSHLTVGMRTGDSLTEVVAVIPYTGLKPTELKYLDESQHTTGKAYYYAVSFHVRLGTPAELDTVGGTDLYFPRLSNVVKVYLSKGHGVPRSITGVPPDWYRTPRTIDLIPAMGHIVDQVSSFVIQFGDLTTGYGDLLKANIKVMTQLINGYVTLATQLTAAASTISAFGSINLGTVSTRAFSGTGGLNFIKRDIVQAFGDTSDPNRPPFDGEEFVSGVVILATTANAAALLDLVLGSVQAGITAITLALEKIDVQLAPIEAATFTTSMAVGVPTSLSTTSTTTTALVGEDASYCYQTYAPSTTFNDQLKPI